MNRRTAINALVAAMPGMATMADMDIKWGDALILKHQPIRVAARLTNDGWVEFPLDNWCGWRVTLGSEAIEITAAELFEALRSGAGGGR